MRFALSFHLLFLLIATAIPSSLRAEPDNIDVILFKTVPRLVQQLRERDIRNVGVLPFQFRDNVGVAHSTGALIQSNLAARTEQVIAYIRDVDDPVNVVFNMLSQARALDATAAYDTKDACEKLLALTYNYPVDEMSASKLDGFVTGIIEVSKDWKQSSLVFKFYNRKTGDFGELGPFTFPTDRKMLMQFGRAYSLTANGWDARLKGVQTRSIFSLIERDEKELESIDRQKAAEIYVNRVGESVDGNPWKNFPVTLTVKYDNQPQTLSMDTYLNPFNFSIPDPKPNQRVSFELKNNLNEKLAVVLAINGKSLIYQENANDPDACNKFALDPAATYSVPGVYVRGLNSYQPLLSTDDQQTSDLAKRYPSETVGIISLSVYREVPSYDPGGVSHFVSQGATTANTSEASTKTVAEIPNTEKGTTKKSKLEFLSDDNETWYNSFRPSLLRSGSSKGAAKGSFHPSPASSKAKSWSELSKGIGRNALVQTSTRGLIVPTSSETKQKLGSTTMGTVSQSDVAIIRYLTIPRQ